MPRRYWNYGHTVSTVPAKVHHPKSVAELGAILKAATDENLAGKNPPRRITFRAAGQAFGRTSLSVDGGEMIRLDELPDPFIGAKVVGSQLFVEADGWARWGEVFDAVRAAGDTRWVPVAVPTSRRVTVAGYIAADGLSRFSPVVGKFSHAIEWMKVLLPKDGVEVTVHRPYPNPTTDDQKTNNARFAAIVGGCGLAGFVTRVRFRVPRIKVTARTAGATTLRAWTRLGRYDDYDQLLRAIVDWQRQRSPTLNANGELVVIDAIDPLAHKAPSGFVLMNDKDDKLERGAVAVTGLTDDKGGTNSFILWDRCKLRFAFRFLMDLDALPVHAAHADWTLWTSMGRSKDTLGRDDLCEYTFFFEAHSIVRDKLVGRGANPQAHTQCYLIPLGDYADSNGWCARRALTFIRRARKVLRGSKGVRAQAIDALFMPPSQSTLAGLKGQAALLFTFSLEGVHNYKGQKVDGKRVATGLDGICDAFRKVSHLAASLGGRVQVGKQVYADDNDLRVMMHAGAKAFLDATREVDPGRVLSSRFAEEVIAVAVKEEGDGLDEPDLEDLGTGHPTPRDGFDLLRDDVKPTFRADSDKPSSDLDHSDCGGVQGWRAQEAPVVLDDLGWALLRKLDDPEM